MEGRRRHRSVIGLAIESWIAEGIERGIIAADREPMQLDLFEAGHQVKRRRGRPRSARTKRNARRCRCGSEAEGQR